MLDFGLYFFYVLCLIAIVAAVGFSIYNMMSKPGALIRSLIVVGILAAIFGASFALSSGDVNDAERALGITESTSKMVGAGLIMFYIVIVLAFVSLIYSEITKAFK